jgi:hypothetical protein
MSVGPLSLPDLRPDAPLDKTSLAAEAESLTHAIKDHLNNPADPSALMRRISLLEDQARNLTTDDLSCWLESLREILEPARRSGKNRSIRKYSLFFRSRVSKRLWLG